MHDHEQPIPILVLQNDTEDVPEDTYVGAECDGHFTPKLARFTFDPSGDATLRTVADHGLGVYLPDNAVPLYGAYDVITPFAGGSGATLGVNALADGDLVETAPVEEFGTAGPALFFALALKTTARREITATVAGAALTAGKLLGWIAYVVSE